MNTMNTTTDCSWIAAVYNKVDEFYTPAEGVKKASAMLDLDNMILNFVGKGALVKKGLITADETWEIYCYLMSVRKDLLNKHGLLPSSLADCLPTTKMVTTLCQQEEEDSEDSEDPKVDLDSLLNLSIVCAVQSVLPEGMRCEPGANMTFKVRNEGGTYKCFTTIPGKGFCVEDADDCDSSIQATGIADLVREVVSRCRILIPQRKLFLSTFDVEKLAKQKHVSPACLLRSISIYTGGGNAARQVITDAANAYGSGMASRGDHALEILDRIFD